MQSDAYHDVALHYAVLAMLAVPAMIAIVPRRCIDQLSATLLGWNSQFERAGLMVLLFALLASVFLLTRLVMGNMALRMKLTPGRTKTRRVHRRAVELFRSGCELKREVAPVFSSMSRSPSIARRFAPPGASPIASIQIWGEAMEFLMTGSKRGNGRGQGPAVEQVVRACASAAAIVARHDELPDRLVLL